ncbi:hypothetical protein GCM10010841_29910 [Deinococcus aerophilus]|uniref:Uncharacterized protein n=1 Tax=Deinococcus aerophilus TaxID=522488 RepID=A0ABQ2GY98_9DEIO|nr:hypothetical protein GCM10010841_29910 [Deinococcus aerophilus]
MNSPPTFNLLHEPWIPVRPLNGGAVREVGLRELLLHARTYSRIDDPSPKETPPDALAPLTRRPAEYGGGWTSRPR